MTDVIKKENNCSHPNLKEYIDETKVFEIVNKKKQIVRTIHSSYYYCDECNNRFYIKVDNNPISNN